MLGRLEARLIGVGAVRDQRLVDLDAGLGERVAIAGEPQTGSRHGWAGR